jgi:S1-C subfamily serine protease
MANGTRNMMVKLVVAGLIGAGVIAAAPTVAGLLPDGLDPFASAQATVAAPTASPPASLPIAQAPRRVPATKGEAIASYAPVVEGTAPAVVNVYARSVQRGRVAVDPFWGAFRIPDRASQSQGSGVIVRRAGHDRWHQEFRYERFRTRFLTLWTEAMTATAGPR